MENPVRFFSTTEIWLAMRLGSHRPSIARLLGRLEKSGDFLLYAQEDGLNRPYHFWHFIDLK